MSCICGFATVAIVTVLLLPPPPPPPAPLQAAATMPSTARAAREERRRHDRCLSAMSYLLIGHRRAGSGRRAAARRRAAVRPGPLAAGPYGRVRLRSGRHGAIRLLPSEEPRPRRSWCEPGRLPVAPGE